MPRAARYRASPAAADGRRDHCPAPRSNRGLLRSKPSARSPAAPSRSQQMRHERDRHQRRRDPEELPGQVQPRPVGRARAVQLRGLVGLSAPGAVSEPTKLISAETALAPSERASTSSVSVPQGPRGERASPYGDAGSRACACTLPPVQPAGLVGISHGPDRIACIASPTLHRRFRYGEARAAEHPCNVRHSLPDGIGPRAAGCSPEASCDVTTRRRARCAPARRNAPVRSIAW